MSDYSDFPWRPGMRVLPDPANKGARMVLGSDHRWVFAVEAGIEVTRVGGPCVEAWSDDAITGEEVPDLTDPATVGALAGAVREAFGRPDLYARPLLPGGWAIGRSRLLPTQPAVASLEDTEGEAWLAAWRARPTEGA